MLTDHLNVFFRKLSVGSSSENWMSGLLDIVLKLVFTFVYYWVIWVPYIFWLLISFTRYTICKCFLPLCRLHFSICWLFPLFCKSFLVWCSPTCLFLLLLPVLLDWHLKDSIVTVKMTWIESEYHFFPLLIYLCVCVCLKENKGGAKKVSVLEVQWTDTSSTCLPSTHAAKEIKFKWVACGMHNDGHILFPLVLLKTS